MRLVHTTECPACHDRVMAVVELTAKGEEVSQTCPECGRRWAPPDDVPHPQSEDDDPPRR